MAQLRLRAIVLRRIPYSETSWILHVFTREEGAMSLLARGARRPSSPLAGTLEPLGLSELEVAAKPGRDLQTLSQAVAMDPRSRLRRDLAASAVGLVCAETVLRLAREPGEHRGIFDALESALSDLDSRGYLPAILWRFLARFSEEMGWAMAIEHCAQCGGLHIPTEPVLSLAHGGFLCRDCGIRSHEPPLPMRMADALRASCGSAAPTDSTWSRIDSQWLEDLWFDHLVRHSQQRPRMDSRLFLSEVRP